MKKEFSEEHNREIHYACNCVRALITVSSISAQMKSTEGDLENISVKTRKDSKIYKLIELRDWENLFSDKDWLSILEAAQNLNLLTDGSYTNFLRTIVEFFPEETKGHIVVEFL